MSADEIPLLDIASLEVTFGGTRAVSGLTFRLAPGERAAIIGPNGAGKSTVINAVAGTVRPSGGTIRYGARALHRESPHRRARLGIRRTFQHLSLFDRLSIEENLRVANNTSSRRTISYRCDELIDAFELGTVRDVPVGLLPYGTRKLTELARALSSAPDLLLLDEPAAGLATGEKAKLVRLLDAVIPRGSVAVLLIEHDMETVERLCPDHVCVIDAGSKIAEGPFRTVTRDPAVVTAYLGTA